MFMMNYCTGTRTIPVVLKVIIEAIFGFEQWNVAIDL